MLQNVDWHVSRAILSYFITLHSPIYGHIVIIGELNVDWDTRRAGVMKDKSSVLSRPLICSLTLSLLITLRTDLG